LSVCKPLPVKEIRDLGNLGFLASSKESNDDGSFYEIDALFVEWGRPESPRSVLVTQSHV
jgi:hypothetical protein